MRRLRILIVIFFIAVFAVFLFSRIREFLTSDYTAPVITAEQDSLRVSVDATEQDLLAGLTATDNLDGDVTDTLVVVSKTKFISRGTLRVNYAAFDQNNNVGAYARNVTYVDYHSPRFSMSQPLRFVNGNSKYDYLRFITAEDCLDGNITQQVKITFGQTESVSDTASVQKVNLQVTNSAGDSAVLELTASFEDFTTYSLPAPALSDYIIYVEKGHKPDYESLIKGVWSSGNVRKLEDTDYSLSSNFRIADGAVNYNTSGVYTVTYQLVRTSQTENTPVPLGTATLIVVVED